MHHVSAHRWELAFRLPGHNEPTFVSTGK